ncbi:fimbrial assembly protein, FimB [Paracidovorax avenae ATCC 19860]|uniref:Fimbrial assembly protein, FimB n=1 Tax=Paracidovorax avenae (strain ATCC 19860 / DSM 7227 / CCUG 15838 / JCM 20985 / LMG 2117 / NCPPB 1011) TaxID=643561 RepID=F0QB01_PARA1|nr:hypothetical protein [Paracidovorax avenae]ADX48496.1 fimbrial assembly protein, FimB [Paracidovorax avenae ATCC 19860]
MRFYISKIRAFFVHFIISIVIVSVISAVAFVFFYPFPYIFISGGAGLFLFAALGVVLGPLLTFVFFNPKKNRKEKILDFSVVACLQVCAIAYGIFSAYEARPIHVVFEYDRFRVIHANDIPEELILLAPKDIIAIPKMGITWLALRPLSSLESFNFTMQALDGVAVSAQTQLWIPYEQGLPEILKEAKLLKQLINKFPDRKDEILDTAVREGLDVERVKYLPIQGRKNITWTVFLNAQTGQPLGYLNLDSF